MIGEENVYVDTNAVSVSLSNESAGTLEGFDFTATKDTSVAGVNVAIAYGETTLTYAIAFGQGSEVIFDFENADRAGFVGYAEAKQWSAANGVKNGLFDSPYPHDGQMDPFTVATTIMGSKTNGGQVRNGNYALAWRLDNTDPDFEAWSYYYLYNIGEPVVLRDVENGKRATSLGMWVYIPEDAFPTSNGKGFSFQSYLWVKNSEGKLASWAQHFMFTSAATGEKTNLNSATNADIPESRWVYASVDISKYDYVCTPVATNAATMSPVFIRSYAKPNVANEVTFYIDDITLDYSSAVDDRVLPTITNPTYAIADTAVALANGATISGSKVAFSATVSDNAALNYGSGKIYVDGVAIKAAIAGSALSTQEDVKLLPGEHTVAFEVTDALGNPAKITRTFTVSGDAAFALAGHNDSGEPAKAQSVYYVDLKVADLSAVEKMTAVLKLQTANTWETEGAVAAEGFKATYSYNQMSQLLTVNIESVGNAAAEAGTIVSIPVRVWTYNRFDYLNEQYVSKVSSNKPAVRIDCEVVYGNATLSSGSVPFGGSINVATELTSISSPYHVHDAELTVQDQEATCTVAGYQGRTYCETCKSVVAWGTSVAATGHNYAIVDKKFVCQTETCGVVYESGTGAFEMNGALYYSVNGELKTGWQDMDGLYGYAGSDYKMYVGTQTVNGITYEFAADGTTKGAWTTNSTGTRYSVGPSFIKRSWVEIDGAKYYFGEDHYMYTGTRSIPKNRNNLDEGVFWYLFGEDGKFIKDYTDLNGIVEENGNKYWVVDGKNAYGGLMKIGDDYYYARTHGQIVCGATYWITKNNDLLPVANYTFGADGKMINPPVIPDPDQPDTPDVPDAKNGIVSEDGKLWWYVNNVKTYGGLMEINGDYYYARSSGEILTNRTYWITKNNDLLPVANYTFGADGKMLNPPVTEEPDPEPTPDPDTPVVPEVKNGIVEEDGKLWWYVDNVKTYAGLMEINGDYYYARSSGEILTNRTYWITKHNDLLPAANYTFGADGKMVNPPVTEEPTPDPEPDTPVVPEVKNGIVEEDGKLWWYVDDVKTYGGLMEINGDYYYARTSGEILTNRTYWITKTNDLLPAKNYTFGADGKMVNPPASK